jgi:hypothetical protein
MSALVHEAILKACASGDLPTLKEVLGDIRPQPRTEPPAAREHLETAVASRQTTIVKFLLQTYPSLSLSQESGIVHSILDNADADTLRVLCAHDPLFASFSIDYAFLSFLTEACKQPPDKIVPVIHVLLDNDADVHDGFGPGGGALYAALVGSQPREIIERIVKNGGCISWRVLSTAIGKERLDVFPSLLQQRYARSWVAKTIRQEREKSAKKWWQMWKSGAG